MKRYSLSMINRCGYEIRREFSNINSAVRFEKYYSSGGSFFSWLYDRENDEMVMQNQYGTRLRKCNNISFVPYW